MKYIYLVLMVFAGILIRNVFFNIFSTNISFKYLAVISIFHTFVLTPTMYIAFFLMEFLYLKYLIIGIGIIICVIGEFRIEKYIPKYLK